MTSIESKILDYLSTVPNGAWASTSEIAEGAKLFQEVSDQIERRRAIRANLVELVKRGHVSLSDKSAGVEETWQQTQ